jgi:predicted enzyme related to lactoylglutathione lyase
MAITAIKPRANAHGTTNSFWWIDLQSTDVQASLEFYGSVLGWEHESAGDGDAVVYEYADIDGVIVAGFGEMPVQATSTGRPPAWTSYVTVDDVDATCAAAERGGGTVVMPPMDVMQYGRMAVVSDPTGATFGLWQPGSHAGAEAVNQPSTLSWVELYSHDPAASITFYEALFGWGFDRQDARTFADTDYWMITLDGRPIAGLMEKAEIMLKAPDMWLPYIGVADLDATKAEVEAAGGMVQWGPMQTGPGRSIGVRDPQGAVTILMQMDEWPTD